jgi:hypothetical protein
VRRFCCISNVDAVYLEKLGKQSARQEPGAHQRPILT